MATESAAFQIVTVVDDSALKKLIADLAAANDSIAKTQSDILSTISKSSAEAANAVESGEQKSRSSRKKSAEQVVASEKETLNAVEAAERAKEEIDAKYASTREKYSKEATHVLVGDLAYLQQESAKFTQLIKNAEDKATKEELKAKKAAIDEEKSMLNQLARQNEDVQHKGAGVAAGILGIFRKVTGVGTNETEAHLKHLESENTKIQQQITATDNAEDTKRLQHHKAALEQEISEVKKEQAAEHAKEASESKKEHGSIVGAVAGGAAVAGAVEALKMLKEHAEEAKAANDQLRTGLAATGLAGEKLEKEIEGQEPSVKKMSQTYAVSAEEVKSAMGKMAAMSNLTGDALKQATEDAIIVAKSKGESIESVVKIMGKATNEEIEGNATKLGISLSKTMSAEERAAKIHAAAMQRKTEVVKASNDGAGAMNRLMNTLNESVGDAAMKLLNALTPALDAILPIIESLADVAGNILKPVLSAVMPIVTMLAASFGKLAPIIADLITNGMEIITPIFGIFTDVLGAVLPAIMSIAKTLGEALMPIMKAVVPVVTTLAKAFSAELIAAITPVITLFADVLAPILRDVIAPLLVSLMPLLQMVANILVGIVVPAIQLLSSILNFVISDGIQPLVKWVGGFLKDALEAIVGVITKVVGAIKSIVSAVGSVIGISDAKAETKKQVEGVVQAQHEGTEQVVAENDRKDKALEAARKKAEADAKKHHAAQAKAGKDAFAAARKGLDAHLAEEKLAIEKGQADGTIDDELAKHRLLEAQLKHDEEMMALTLKSGNDILAAETAVAKDRAALRKEGQSNYLADSKAAEEAEIYAIEISGAKTEAKEAVIQKSITDIKRKYLLERAKVETDMGMENSESAKALGQLALEDLRENNKENLAEVTKQKSILKEIDKARADAAIEGLTDVFDKEKAKEQLRYSEELEARSEDLKNLAMGAKLKESLETQHQSKMLQIQKQSDNERSQKMLETLNGLGNIAKASNDERLNVASQFAEKELGIQGIAEATKSKNYGKFLSDQAITLAVNLAHQVATVGIAETAKGVAVAASQAWQTATVVAGFLAREATYIAEGIASAASAAGTWIAAAAKAAANAFSALPFPIDILGAAAAVTGVGLLAAEVPKLFHADGGIIQKQLSMYGGGANHVFGEAGDEAVIPLDNPAALSKLFTALQPSPLHALAPHGFVPQSTGVAESHSTLKEIASLIKSQKLVTTYYAKDGSRANNMYALQERRRSF